MANVMYGGTKEEMERLIADANKVKAANGEMAELSIDSFADVVEAIHIMQEEMQIGGTTAREAATTIEGSVDSMKAAWENWLTGLGDSDADMAQLTENLVSSFETAAENVVPRIAIILGTLIGSVPSLAAEVGPVAAEALKETFTTSAETFRDMLPEEAQEQIDATKAAFENSGLADSVGSVLGSIADAGAQAADGIGQLAEKFDGFGAAETAATALELFSGFIDNIAAQAGEYLMPALENAGEQVGLLGQAFEEAQVWMQPLADLLGNILVGAVVFLVDAFSVAVGVITTVIEAITSFVDGVTQAPQSVQAFVDQVGAFFGQLPGLVGGFLASVIAAIADWVSQTVANGAQAGSQFLQSVGDFFGQLPGRVGGFLGDVISRIGAWVGEMASNAANAASSFGSSLLDGLASIPGRVVETGSQIIGGIVSGITGAAGSVVSAVTGAVGGAIEAAKNMLGIHSPSRVFRDMFGYVMKGAALGIEDNDELPVNAMKTATEKVEDAARFGAKVASAGMEAAGGAAAGEPAVIAWLAANLPAIIAQYTPVMGESEFGRKARKAVAYA